MIIQIVGTNGAGKSTVVRAVMAQGRESPVESAGRVIGHDVALAGVYRCVRVVGAYGAAATGGCDTIKSAEEIYAWVEEAARAGHHVLFEGIRALNQTQGPLLAARVATTLFVVVALTTPLGVSLASIDARRAARGAGAFAAPTGDIEGNHTRARNYAARMRDVGARVIHASREEAPAKVLALLASSA